MSAARFASLQGAPKRCSRAQWEFRVKCELLHTGRPPSSDILSLCRTAPYGEISVNLHLGTDPIWEMSDKVR